MNDFELIPAYPDVNVADYQYKTRHSSGIDLLAYLNMDDRDEVCQWMWEGDEPKYFKIIYPHHQAIFDTGLKINFINKDLEAQIRTRSGLALKTGLFVLNSPGTIDADYEGNIKVILFNPTQYVHRIYVGDRIAQLVVSPVVRNPSHIKHAIRGEGGFGSTGIKG